MRNGLESGNRLASRPWLDCAVRYRLSMPMHDQPQLRFVRELCKQLSAEEIDAAQTTFRSYVRTAWSIFERIEQERAQAENSQQAIRQYGTRC